MRFYLTLGRVVPLILAAGCAPHRTRAPSLPPVPTCTPPMAPYFRSNVYLDRSNTSDPLRPYSEAEWERFIDEVLITHLPSGGTVFENTGWWRRPDGSTFRGIGRTLTVLAPASDSTMHRAGVTAVIAAIQQRYGHRLVIREEALVCAAF